MKIKRPPIIVFIIAILILVDIIPIKMAVKLPSEGTNKESLFICTEAVTTGPSWELIGDEKGIFPNNSGELVILKGNAPYKMRETLQGADEATNTYIIKGKIVGEDNYGIENEHFKVIEATDWEIAYPINRGAMLFRIVAPKRYLTIYDYLGLR